MCDADAAPRRACRACVAGCAESEPFLHRWRLRQLLSANAAALHLVAIPERAATQPHKQSSTMRTAKKKQANAQETETTELRHGDAARMHMHSDAGTQQ